MGLPSYLYSLDEELLSLFSFSFLIKKLVFQFCDIKDFPKRKKNPKKIANLGIWVSHEKNQKFPNFFVIWKNWENFTEN